MASDSSSSSESADIKYHSLHQRSTSQSLDSISYQKSSTFIELRSRLEEDEEDDDSTYYPTRSFRRPTAISNLCNASSFSDFNTEQLYREYAFFFECDRFARYLILFIVISSTLSAFNCALNGWNTNLRNVIYMLGAFVCLTTLIFLKCRFMRTHHLSPLMFLVFLLSILFFTTFLPVESAARNFALGPIVTLTDGLWQTVFLILNIYLFFPAKLFSLLSINIILSMSHLMFTAVLVYLRHYKENNVTSMQLMNLFWRMLGANVTLFFAINSGGIFMNRWQEHIVRKSFLETKFCIEQWLEVKEQNKKLNQLIACVAPPKVTKFLHRDTLLGNVAWITTNVSIVHNLSILSAKFVGFSQLKSHSSVASTIQILNGLFCRFDQLTLDYHCYRLRIEGDEYLALCGFPEPSMEHASNCVDLALAICSVVNKICNTANVGLDLRIGIHSGFGYGAFIGKLRLSYDFFGNDVCTAHRLQQMCTPGKVLISTTTLAGLSDDYYLEQGSTLERNDLGENSLPLETFYVTARGSPGEQCGLLHLPRLQNLDAEATASVLTQLVQCSQFNAKKPFQFLAETKHLCNWNETDTFFSTSSKRTEDNFTSENHFSFHRYFFQLYTLYEKLIKVKQSINILTFRFKRSDLELQFHRRDDPYFGFSMVCAIMLLTTSAIVQIAVLPRTIYLLLLFMLAFTWICILLLILLAGKFKCLEFEMQNYFVVRIVVVLISIFFAYSMSQVNVICCPSLLAIDNSSLLPLFPMASTSFSSPTVSCPLPMYIPLAATLCLLFVAVFFILPAILKCFLLLLIMASFIIFMHITHNGIFLEADKKWNSSFLYSDSSRVREMSSLQLATVCLFTMTLLFIISSRFFDYVARLIFLWHTQAVENLREKFLYKDASEKLLCNLLPHAMVVSIFNDNHCNDLNMYTHEFSLLGVLCARIADWYPTAVTKSGHVVVQNALFVLNSIICEFDEMLKQSRYHDLCKVRSIADNYLIAVGVNSLIQENTVSQMHQLSFLLHFALAMKRKMLEFKEPLYKTKLSLRIGVDLGAGCCNIMGGEKPVFDVMGDARLGADLLQATAALDRIHVSEMVKVATHSIFEFSEQGTFNNCERQTFRSFYLNEDCGYPMPVSHDRYLPSTTFASSAPLNGASNSNDCEHNGSVLNSDTMDSPVLLQCIAKDAIDVDSAKLHLRAVSTNCRSEDHRSVHAKFVKKEKQLVSTETQTSSLSSGRQINHLKASKRSTVDFLITCDNNSPVDSRFPERKSPKHDQQIQCDEEPREEQYDIQWLRLQRKKLNKSNKRAMIHQHVHMHTAKSNYVIPSLRNGYYVNEEDLNLKKNVLDANYELVNVSDSSRTFEASLLRNHTFINQICLNNKHSINGDYHFRRINFESEHDGHAPLIKGLDQKKSLLPIDKTCADIVTTSLLFHADTLPFSVVSSDTLPSFFKSNAEKAPYMIKGNGDVLFKFTKNNGIIPLCQANHHADSLASLIEDSVYPSGDELENGNYTDLDFIRPASDMADDLSDLVISDLESEASFSELKLPFISTEIYELASTHKRLPDIAPVLMPDFSNMMFDDFLSAKFCGAGNINHSLPTQRHSKALKHWILASEDCNPESQYREVLGVKKSVNLVKEQYFDTYSSVNYGGCESDGGLSGYCCDVPSSYESQMESDWDNGQSDEVFEKWSCDSDYTKNKWKFDVSARKMDLIVEHKNESSSFNACNESHE